MSEPLWFLDTISENDQESQENVSSKLKSEPEKWSQEYSSTSNPKSSEKFEKNETTQYNNFNNIEVSRDKKNNAQSILLDEASLKSELESSFLDIAKNSIKTGENPEIRITINTDDLQLNSANEKSFLTDDANNQDLYDESYTKEKVPKIKVKLNVSKDGKTVGEEKQFEIDSSLISDDTSMDENKNKPYNPKVYVVVSSNKEGKSAEFEKDLNSTSSDNQYCTEIGSAVIKLNDFISTETPQKSDDKTIISNLNDSSQNGGKKVELVITIKDKRKKNSKPETNFATPEFAEEEILQRLQSSESISKKNLESELKNIRERIQYLSNTVNANSAAQNRETTAYRKYSNDKDVENQWSNETRDSFVRETDGARCYRTVWTSPEGRRVQTQCYGDDRHPPRQRKSFGRARNYNWYPSFGSLWQEMDNEFDRLFSHVDRFMYF